MALFKKSLIALILVVPFLLWFGVTVQAYGTGIINSEPEVENNGADIYHELVGEQRAYIHMSLPRYTSTGSYMTSYDTNSEHVIKFYGARDIYFDRDVWNPDTSIFNMFVIETVDAQGNYVVEYSSREASHNLINIMGTSEGIEISIIQQYPGTSFTTKEHMYYLFDSTKYRIYWAISNVYEEMTVDDLPETAGSPYKKGEYGTVTLSTNGSYLDVQIQYVDIYELETLLVDDITAFQNVQYAYYWTDNNNKFITMTYEEKEPVYLSSLPIQARPWTQTVTWNLTTNEIRSVNKVDVFAYHAKDSNRNIYTYMYMPNTIHDSLISVTAKMSYKFQWYIGESNVRTDTIVLKSGDKNTFSPSWEKKLLYFYLVPGYTLSEIGSKLLDHENPYLSRSLDQISVVSNPTSELVEKITGAWNEAYDTNVVIDTDSNKLYRLNWGQYDEWGARNVYLVEDTFQFSEIVFVQNGQVKLLTFDDIILKDVIDDTLKPTTPGMDFFKMFMDVVKAHPVEAVVVAVVILVIILILFSTVLAPFASVLSVFVKVFGIILEGVARVFVALISRPWFWVLSLVGSIIYVIYINI